MAAESGHVVLCFPWREAGGGTSPPEVKALRGNAKKRWGSMRARGKTLPDDLFRVLVIKKRRKIMTALHLTSVRASACVCVCRIRRGL